MINLKEPPSTVCLSSLPYPQYLESDALRCVARMKVIPEKLAVMVTGSLARSTNPNQAATTPNSFHGIYSLPLNSLHGGRQN